MRSADFTQLLLGAADEEGNMTAPRKVLPKLFWFLTRRCTQRLFLLKPGKYVNRVLLYLLAESAKRFDITVYAFTAMSNHIHMVVRDNEGNLPEFLAHFYKLVAKVLNVHWKRTENLWSNEQASAVRLVQHNDVFDKILYTLVNPVVDHLVEYAGHWPGITSYGHMRRGKPIKAERPRGFFRTDGPMRDEYVLTLARPPGFEDLTQKEWAAQLAGAVRAVEDAAREARNNSESLRRKFVGRKRVRAAKHTDSSKRIEPRRELRPTVACLNRERRILELEAIMRFQHAHHYARIDWSAGNRSVVFPSGTYKMKSFGVLVASEPAATCSPASAAKRGVRKATPRPMAKTAAAKPKPKGVKSTKPTRKASGARAS